MLWLFDAINETFRYKRLQLKDKILRVNMENDKFTELMSERTLRALHMIRKMSDL